MSERIKVRQLKQLRTFEVALEKHGLGPVAGVDEAGRGACCGPITIASCILPPQPIKELEILTDSKKLSERQRAALFPRIIDNALDYRILHIPAYEIDALGIQHANISGMRRVVETLNVRPGFVLIDAMKVPGLTSPSLSVIGGDGQVRCIAAASVLAKYSRDEVMKELSQRYPEYGLEKHKGYGTKAHMAAVSRHGKIAEHRYSYANVKYAQAQWERNSRRLEG
ncbi:Ribonuclease HII [Corynebacterium kutscheri]|uniref:Ribonuclease HII n=1 Tax=Corynebacterium kutscheri TaxID=35755 RepID=A0A0F6TD69_9CORY|nr:ribonuclease HII [Corynebacterium kutscheri]AKE41479.1 RNase HII [Corynebacterium kutscheri]VEH08757.1 Ribonuclease HII [Corynebacterium kutscheri]VEH09803.1 Ribonuclease HII [Corynebacterium kutscheri]VEH79886.1 Ribonuclease HII [Corynebacterium kutscheri]